MVTRTPHGADAAPPARLPRQEPIEVVGVEFGPFREISRLNPRFQAELERMKLTLEVNLSACDPRGSPAAFVEALKEILPSLARHRCCGDNALHETFFKREVRRGCAMRETDETVDVAHLLEHLVIDFQHYIADMRTCSGVTCGYESPRYRYDVFIESPNQKVSHLCVALARSLMNDLLEGIPPDALYAKIVKVARRFYRSPGVPLSAAAARAALDVDGDGETALRALRELGFIEEIETSINFSRVPLYRFDLNGGRGAER